MKKTLISLLALGAWLALAGSAWADSGKENSNNNNSSNSNSNSNNTNQPKIPWYKKYNPWGKTGPYGRYSKLPYKKNTPSTTLSLSDKNPRYDHWSSKGIKQNSNATLLTRKLTQLRLQQGKKLKKRWFLTRFFNTLKRGFLSIKLPFFKDSRARMNNRDLAASSTDPFHNSGGFGAGVQRSSRLVRDRWMFKKGKLPRRKQARRTIRIRRFHR